MLKKRQLICFSFLLKIIKFPGVLPLWMSYMYNLYYYEDYKYLLYRHFWKIYVVSNTLTIIKTWNYLPTYIYFIDHWLINKQKIQDDLKLHLNLGDKFSMIFFYFLQARHNLWWNNHLWFEDQIFPKDRLKI